MVDGYGGDKFEGRPEMESGRPPTLGEVADFFLTVWPPLDVLDINFEGGLDASGSASDFPTTPAKSGQHAVRRVGLPHR